jgi:thiol-disulfide isomerase/thioredoxin
VNKNHIKSILKHFLFLALIQTSLRCAAGEVHITGKAHDPDNNPITTGTIYVKNIEDVSLYVGGFPSVEVLAQNAISFPLQKDGSFKITLNTSAPHYIFFTSPGKKTIQILYPSRQLDDVGMQVKLYDEAVKRDERIPLVETSDNTVNLWIKVLTLSSVSIESDVKKQMDSSILYMQKYGGREGFKYHLTDYYNSMLNIYYASDDRDLKNYVLLNLSFLCIDNKYPVEEKYLLEAVQTISPSDPIWLDKGGHYPGWIYQGLGTFSHNKAILKPFLEELYRQCPVTSRKPQELYALLYYAKSANQPEADGYYAALLENYPGTKEATRAVKENLSLKKINKGGNIPSLAVIDADKTGAMITNETLKGKLVLIDFWATWCGPCIKEFDSIEKVYQKYKNSGFAILTISLDKDIRLVKAFRKKKHSLPWMNGFAADNNTKLVNDFEVVAIPRMILVNGNGVVISDNPNELEGGKLDKMLDELLNKKH